MCGMVLNMMTMLNVNENVMRALKTEAARQGVSVSKLLENTLCTFLDQKPKPAKLPSLPAFRGGGARVNVANRDMLYNVALR